MRTVLVYPIPFNVWDQYRPLVRRFARTFKEHPPGCDYELVATCHWGEPTDYVREWFYGIKTRFVPYYDNGCQIGAQFSVAGTMENAFIIGLTSHSYFHRAGWLERFMAVAEEENYKGLFGACGSCEGRPHLRTNLFGMEADYWHAFPLAIQSRADCSRFECGDWSVADWFFQMTRKHPLVVHWDSVNSIKDRVANGYRDGNQEQLLAWDRHTEEYQNATEERRAELSALASGEKIERDKPAAKE